jgi:hypothetical protein
VSTVAETEPTVTATLQLLIDGLPSKFVAEAGDALMVSLLGHAKVIDPVVSGDLDAGELSVSFEFEATGNVQADVRHAMRLLRGAAEGGQSRQFDWSRWLWDTDIGRTGSVQYPLVGAVAQ